MAAPPFSIVGFDLDGTLVDTSGDLAAAVNHALSAAGRPALAVERIRTMIGGGAKAMLRLGLDESGGCADGEFRRLYQLLLGWYEAHIAVTSVPFSGAVEALDRLRASGVACAVVTNKFERLAEQLLVALGLRGRFTALIGGDTMGSGLAKPNRAPIDEMIRRCGGGTAAFVGDTIYDVLAAQAAGIPSIVVSFGFRDRPVELLGADRVIDGYGDLAAALAALSPGDYR